MKNMSKKTPINSKNNGNQKLRHQSEYADFVLWTSLPKELRDPKTQRELAREFGVGEDTVSEWKTRPGFWDAVSAQRLIWGKDKTSDVMHALYKRVLENGAAPEVRLWMEVIENWSSKEAKTLDIYADIRAMTDQELESELKKLHSFFSKTSDN